MLAIDDFGRPRRRASSLGPTASEAVSARTSRISAARVTAGARDSGSASRSTAVFVIGLPFRAVPAGRRRRSRSLASRMDRVQHIDFRAWRSLDCSTYRRSFSMLDEIGRGSRGGDACRGSDRSRPRSAWRSCWRPVQRNPRRHRPPHPPPHRRRPRRRVAAAVGAAASAEAPSAAAACATDGKFAGVNVNILTFNGPQVAEPLQRRAPDWECLTGGHVNVVAVGFQTIYDKALLDASTGTNAFDAYVFNPQWLGDFVGPGYLADLTDRVNNDAQLDWQDIGPFFRDFNATYNGKVYTIPLDGDFHMVYYRKDILDKDGVAPPKTWDDYLTIAEKYNGQDLNEDGEPDYGSCIAKKKGAQSYWWIISVAAGLLQGKGTERRRVLRHLEHEPAVRQQRGHDQGAPDVQEDDRRSARPTSSTWTSAAPAACSRPGAAPCRWTGATSGP